MRKEFKDRFSIRNNKNLTFDCPIPFGKYKGMSLKRINQIDKEYVSWFIKNVKCAKHLSIDYSYKQDMFKSERIKYTTCTGAID